MPAVLVCLSLEVTNLILTNPPPHCSVAKLPPPSFLPLVHTYLYTYNKMEVEYDVVTVEEFDALYVQVHTRLRLPRSRRRPPVGQLLIVCQADRGGTAAAGATAVDGAQGEISRYVRSRRAGAGPRGMTLSRLASPQAKPVVLHVTYSVRPQVRTGPAPRCSGGTAAHTQHPPVSCSHPSLLGHRLWVSGGC